MNRRNRVGKWAVLRRFRGAGRDIGRVYTARDEETNSPAVLVAPGSAADWRPVRGWKVTLQASAEPARLTLRVDRAPAGAALQDLSQMMLRLALVVGDLSRRREAREHLTRPHHRLRPLPGFPTLRAAAVVVAAAAIVAVCWLPAAIQDAAAPELPAAVDAPETAYTAGAVPMAPMPRQAFANQKRPPCNAALEDEVVGGCWVRLEVRPPCPAAAYEGGGRCYMPMRAEPKPGQSIGR